MSETVLKLDGVVRTFHQGRIDLEVLKGVNLEIEEGQLVAMVGPSGCGKSTLLHIAGLLEKANAGEVTVCGESGASLGDDARTRLRRHNIGFVYQHHHLLPEFTALENILIPQIIAGFNRAEALERSNQMLEWLGIADRATHRPARLSGGEQQRVAIGRALANTPRLLLADEPTGNLDPETAAEVFELLLKLVRGAKLAAVIATHNPDLAERMDRTVSLKDGVLVE